MKIYMKSLYTAAFTVLVIAMFSGCTSTTPDYGGSYQEDSSAPFYRGAGGTRSAGRNR